MKGKRNVLSEGMELALQGGVADSQVNQVGGIRACGLFAASDLGAQSSAGFSLGRGLSGAPSDVALVVACEVARGRARSTNQKGRSQLHVPPSPTHVR